jgi:flagellar hook protein FlgE
MRLQVYEPAPTGGFNTGSAQRPATGHERKPAAATTSVEMVANLPANATPPTNPTFDPLDPTSYNSATSLTVYDSLGAAHTGTLYFTKTANAERVELPSCMSTATQSAHRRRWSTRTLERSLRLPADGEITFPAYTPATGAAPSRSRSTWRGRRSTARRSASTRSRRTATPPVA